MCIYVTKTLAQKALQNIIVQRNCPSPNSKENHVQVSFMKPMVIHSHTQREKKTNFNANVELHNNKSNFVPETLFQHFVIT